MRRIVLVGGLVVVLAAAIIVPAVAATQPEGTTNPLSAILGSIVPAGVLSSLGIPGPEDLNTDSASSSNTGDPSVSSSDSSSSSTSTSDPSNDPDAVSQEFSERRITSGKASPSFSVSNTGDNSNICATGQQVVNTGNVANEQGVTQYNTKTDDVDITGSSINIDSSATGTCTQTIEQSAAGK